MLRIFSFLLIVFGVSLQIPAQCGVYFKEANRQVFSNSFANSYFEDIDNDGQEDLLGYSLTQNTYNGPRSFQIHFYKRLAANSFDTTAKTTSVSNVYNIYGGWNNVFVVGDVNADGKKDIIVTHMTSPLTLTAYLNDGTGRFLAGPPSVNVSSGEWVRAAGDLNNDGKADVLSTIETSNTSSTLYYRLAQPDDSFGAPVQVATFSGVLEAKQNLSTYAWHSALDTFPMLIEDLDNDGFKDIAFVRTSGNSQVGDRFLNILKNNGSLTFSQTDSVPFERSLTRLRTFDLNNDGKRDFVSYPNSVRVRFALNNGNNTFTLSQTLLPYNAESPYDQYAYTKEFAVADFDGDGDDDVLNSSLKYYSLSKNQGNSTFVQQKFNTFLGVDALANLDNDGKADVVSLVRPLVGGSYILHDGFNNNYYDLYNAVSFRKNVCSVPAGQTKIVDFDGDGATDRAFWNPSTGVWRYYTKKAINSTEQNTFQWGTAGDLPVPNDYDGDHKTDFAVYRPSTGTWWIFRSSDGQYFAQNFGIAEDKPVPADYDGDGKADVAVFRPSTGDWHFWLSRTSAYMVAHFGATGDKPVPSDYDGDGSADIAVFRPSTGTWYRFNSADSSISVTQFGIGTDRPIPGDFDGDGKADIAVYRSGAWYVLGADSSTSVFNYGVAGDEPFFDDSSVTPAVGVFRRSNSTIYTTAMPSGPIVYTYATGSPANEKFVSSILPPE